MSDIECSDDVMQPCDTDAAVATFSELDENIDSISDAGVMPSCNMPTTDLGISKWGARFVVDFVSIC